MRTILPPNGSIARPDSGWDVTDTASVRRRTGLCLAVVALAFFGLLARLYFLQVIKGTQYATLAQRNRLARVSIPAPRGLITDRNGLILATTRQRHAVCVLPAQLPSARRAKEERAKLLKTLGFLIEIPPSEIETRIQAAQRLGARPTDPVVVREDADLTLLTRVEEHKPRLGGAVLVSDDLKRYYPQGAMAAHVMGYSGLVSERDLKRAAGRGKKLRFDDNIGKSGIEREYDDLLRGSRGSQLWEVDAQGRPTREQASIADTPGATLKITLDMKLQRAAEMALAKARNNGAIAAVDPRNGEVLALASRPTFDPNIFSLPRNAYRKAYKNIVANGGHPLLNRAVTSRFPPGSTFKMVTAAAALEKHAVTPGWAVNCPGYFQLGRRFGCWHVHGGGVDLFDAFAGSCDVYFYRASLLLGNPEGSGPTYLAETARRFGLGSKTGIDLPVDEKGLIPDPEWRARINRTRPALARWFPGNTLNMSIGQGDVLATPLQMSLVTAAVANGGTLWKPHLMRQLVGHNGKILRNAEPEGQSVGIAPENLALIRRGLRETVTRGTGKPASLPNVAVAGKTGSAEDVHHTLPHSWWVCFAPYEKPTIAIAVLIENAGHGSENALPIARAVLEAAFPVAAKPKETRD